MVRWCRWIFIQLPGTEQFGICHRGGPAPRPASSVFIFTENSTAEGAYYKGNTPSRTLFELILCLRIIDMQGHLKLYVIHVTGSRMIMQGTDGLSVTSLQE